VTLELHFGHRDALSGVLVPVFTAIRLKGYTTQHTECGRCHQSEARWRITSYSPIYCEPCVEIVGLALAGRGSEMEAS
jgi:hypothetical protein